MNRKTTFFTPMKRGFSLIEIVLALAVSSIAVTIFVGGILYGGDTIISRSLRIQARLSASECLNVSRWMRDVQGLDALTTGTHGLVRQQGQWVLSGANDVVGPFTRQVSFSDKANNVRDVTCQVQWSGQFGQRELIIETQLAQWTD